MPDMPKHAKLTEGQRRALVIAVTLVAAGMAFGFLSSFTTLYTAARAHGWTLPWLLPLAVDSGILAYVLLDHLAVTLGARSRWLHLAAWGLAAFTVWANAAVSPADGDVWRVIHAAMPALWVLGVEALRFMWRRLHADGSQPDRIPAGRWVAAPWPTLLLWRRMRLLGVTAWPLMCAMEDARLHLRDLIEAIGEKYPRRPVPSAVRRVIATGRFPGEVSERIRDGLQYGGAATWEPSLESWLSDRLRLPAGISEAISADAVSTPPEAPPAPVQEPAQDAPQPPVRSAPRTPSQKAPVSAVQRARRKGGRKATDEEIRVAIRELAADVPELKKYRVMKELPVGDERAERLLAEVLAEGEQADEPLAEVRSLR
jgi:Protein of unknown function (DUF2637)